MQFNKKTKIQICILLILHLKIVRILHFGYKTYRLRWSIWGADSHKLTKILVNVGFWSAKPTILQKIKNTSSSQIALRNFCDFVKKMQIPDFVFEFVRSNPGTKINKSQSESNCWNRFHFVWIFCKSLSFLTQIDQIVMKIIAWGNEIQINKSVGWGDPLITGGGGYYKP